MRGRFRKLLHLHRAEGGQELQPIVALPSTVIPIAPIDAPTSQENEANTPVPGNDSGGPPMAMHSPTDDLTTPATEATSSRDVDTQRPTLENDQEGDLELFREAHEQFLASLPSSERERFQRCQSASQLLTELQDIQIAGADSRVRRCLGKIKVFGDAFEPFFTALGFMSQGYPFAAIAWGCILLVLKLTSNYITFFERLASLLNELGLHLPRYNDLAKIWSKYQILPSPRLKSSIVTIYTLLFRFLHDISSIFVNNQKSRYRHLTAVMQTLGILGSLSRKPFDTRFQCFIDHLMLHREIVGSELELETYITSAKTLSIIAKQHEEEVRIARQALIMNGDQVEELRSAKDRLSMIERVTKEQATEDALYRAQRWISPPAFQLEYEIATSKRNSGTCQWLFDHRIFNNWSSSAVTEPAEGFDQSVLSVHGNPGCGKTILAASTVEQLKNRGALVYYYFFRWDNPANNESIHAYQALLAQMLHSNVSDQRLIDAISFCKGREGQLTASKLELIELLDLCFTIQKSIHTYVVLDGVDECSDSKQLVQDLLKMHRNNSIKFLLFSRPNTSDLPKLIAEPRQCAINRENVDDLRLYLSCHLQDMRQNKLLPPDADLKSLLDYLITGADGMFLWARLMMDYLEEATSLTPARRVKIIEEVTFPERLERMYERIRDELSRCYKDDIKFARFIITWLAYAQRPLTTSEMRDAAIVWSTDSDYFDFEPMVLKSCVWLVETFQLFNSRSQRWTQGFRLIHQTVKEYITQSVQDVNPLVIDELHAHYDIAHICAKYVKDTLPHQPLSGTITEDIPSAEIDDRLPLCDYATNYWIRHLNALQDATKDSLNRSLTQEQRLVLLDLINALLSQKDSLMAWLEAVFIFKHRPDYKTLRKWSKSLTASGSTRTTKGAHPVVKSSLSFAKELKQLDHDWSKCLTQSPCHIWLEVTAFGKYAHLQQSGNTKYTSFHDEENENPLDRSEYLTKIDMEAIDGTRISKLIIIPSRTFIQITLKDTLADPLELLSACSGWVAQYEVWTTGRKPCLVTRIVIPLDKDEIWTLMHQCLWFGSEVPSSPQDMKSLCKLHFPLTVSRTLKTFIVLRDIYEILSPNQVKREKDYRTSRVSFTSSPNIQPNFDREYLSARFHRRISSVLWGCPRGHVLFDTEGYLYFFKFSDDGRYLLFRDQDCRDSETHSSLTVLELIDSELGLWSLVAATTRQSPSLTANTSNLRSRTSRFNPVSRLEEVLYEEVEIAFHPSKAFLLIQCSRRVHLWPFKSSSSKFFLCYSSIVPSICGPVTFSECGQYVLINENHKTRLIFYPIPKVVFKQMKEEEGTHHEGQNTSAVTSLDFTQNSLVGRGSSFAQNKLVQSSFGRLGPDGTSTAITIAHSSNGVSFEVFNGAEKGAVISSSTVDVARLPEWSCMSTDSTDISIMAPKVGDKDVRIFLKKREGLWSAPSPLDIRFPAIVHRDISTIRVPKTAGLLLGYSSELDEEQAELVM